MEDEKRYVCKENTQKEKKKSRLNESLVRKCITAFALCSLKDIRRKYTNSFSMHNGKDIWKFSQNETSFSSTSYHCGFLTKAILSIDESKIHVLYLRISTYWSWWNHMHMACLLQSFPSTFSLEQNHSYITYEQQPYRVCITFRSSLSIDLLMSFVDLTQIQALDWSMIKNLSIGDIYSLVQATPHLNSLIFEHVASLFIPPAHIYSCTINKWRLSDEFN